MPDADAGVVCDISDCINRFLSRLLYRLSHHTRIVI